MSWWRNQNLEGPLRGPDDRLWHFLVWHGTANGVYAQRIFFWDDRKTETGFVELSQGQTLHVSKIRDRQRKLARDKAYRETWLQPLEFPIERHWPVLDSDEDI